MVIGQRGSWFSEDERAALLDFWRICDRHYDDTQRHLRARLGEHPTLGAMLSSIARLLRSPDARTGAVEAVK